MKSKIRTNRPTGVCCICTGVACSDCAIPGWQVSINGKWAQHAQKSQQNGKGPLRSMPKRVCVWIHQTGEQRVRGSARHDHPDARPNQGNKRAAPGSMMPHQSGAVGQQRYTAQLPCTGPRCARRVAACKTQNNIHTVASARGATALPTGYPRHHGQRMATPGQPMVNAPGPQAQLPDWTVCNQPAAVEPPSTNANPAIKTLGVAWPAWFLRRLLQNARTAASHNKTPTGQQFKQSAHQAPQRSRTWHETSRHPAATQPLQRRQPRRDPQSPKGMWRFPMKGMALDVKNGIIRCATVMNTTATKPPTGH